ncbi:hypothetical protein D3C72_2082180 [compost metagenome]
MRGVLDPAEGGQKFGDARGGQRKLVALGRRQLAQQGGAGRFQDRGDLQKTGGGDAIDAPLILLNLLEGDAGAGGQLRLSDTKFFATRTDASADGDVYGIYCVVHLGLRTGLMACQGPKTSTPSSQSCLAKECYVC